MCVHWFIGRHDSWISTTSLRETAGGLGFHGVGLCKPVICNFFCRYIL